MCGSDEHIKTDCNVSKKDPKHCHDEWFINQAAVNAQKRCNQHQEQQKEEEQKSVDDNAMSAVSTMTGDNREVWVGSKRSTKTGSSDLQLPVDVNDAKKDEENHGTSS